MEIEKLQQQFGIAGTANFYHGQGNLPFIEITNRYCSAAICLYGAQLLSYIPAGQADLIWVSSKSLFEEGKAIRGGIPICFPWFGPHATDSSKPQHGFARLSDWQVIAVQQLADGVTHVQLALQQSDATIVLWPHHFSATLNFMLGTALEVSLTVTNTGEKPFEYSDALHTYFNISDIAAVTLDGFDKAVYYEAFGQELLQQDKTLLDPARENNRRYVQHTGEAVINDAGYQRAVAVSKTGSKVTVVWNPGPVTTQKISDMEPEGYRTFICVEPANAYTGIDIIHLSPGEKFSLSTTIKII